MARAKCEYNFLYLPICPLVQQTPVMINKNTHMKSIMENVPLYSSEGGSMRHFSSAITEILRYAIVMISGKGAQCKRT